jgi:hypothetical protein
VTRKAIIGALVALSLASIYMSWGSLYELALAMGMPAERAIVWPAVIDVVTIVALVLALQTNARYAWATLAGFGLVTIAGNAMHAVIVPTELVKVDTWIAVVGSSLPAVALLVTTHLAAVTIFRKPDAPKPFDYDAQWENLPADFLEGPPDFLSESEKQAYRDTALENGVANSIPADKSARIALVKALKEANPDLSTRDIEVRTNIPRSTVARYLRVAA